MKKKLACFWDIAYSFSHKKMLRISTSLSNKLRFLSNWCRVLQFLGAQF